MGFYESIYDCGDGCYCVAISSSLDMFKSTDWKFCQKHKNPDCRTYCKLSLFSKKYSKSYCSIISKAKIISTKENTKGFTLAKIELDITIDTFNKLNLMESKKIYFSEFNDEPSWQIINDKIYVIDILSQFELFTVINSPLCNDTNILYNWYTSSIMTRNEYDKWYETEKINF